ncbi:hypothetical protein C4N15_05350 [Fusobacterium necrophorum subsp. funduliforme]|uniref:hypothetical protein n=2 Tax=Fusobacterium necrophorum TaxID=859 RepID=UPI000245E1FB|nr:hypothetical protein [Fusobacterium necrophorum]AVQ21095.1 hypothetical protein C4N15_05350 [Fusobacterium necrophorum subsp. funduliforme]EHO18846.1 hypothetical protein HMPREF9466_02124 [Fusobacterium necrophorum subsp. funduliforme 1_1_36S]
MLNKDIYMILSFIRFFIKLIGEVIIFLEFVYITEKYIIKINQEEKIIMMKYKIYGCLIAAILGYIPQALGAFTAFCILWIFTYVLELFFPILKNDSITQFILK